MSTRLVTPPANSPISLETLKAHLRVDFADEDSLIEAYLLAATSRAEQITGRALCTQTIEDRLVNGCGEIDLARWPVQTIKSVTVDGNPITDYQSVVGDEARIWGLPKGLTLVQYMAGYSDDGKAVPAPILQWIMAAVGVFYQNRETEVTDTRIAVAVSSYLDALLDSYIVYWG